MGTSVDAGAALAAAVEEYRQGGGMATLLARLDSVATGATPERLIELAAPFHDMPEVAGPLYELIVDARPDDADALVRLASAYWLAGRGPDVVGDLASRAIAARPDHRGAWHLWALTESDPRGRVARWQQVVARFPTDDLARANLADNAASLAGAEHDPEALALAIEMFEALEETATEPRQREALANALRTLRAWKL